MRKVKISFAPYRLRFKEPGGTSRGILREKPTYFLRVADRDHPGLTAYGEVPVFPGLSKESVQALEKKLRELTRSEDTDAIPDMAEYSSLIFGWEQAMASLARNDTGLIFPSGFTSGESSIEINGLIWMNDFETMRRRMLEKLHDGFHCIKIKIGAIDWARELKLLQLIRETAGEGVTIRVDANGAFTPENCMYKLEQLARLDVHSIEQPIRQGNFREMRKICRESPIPVALDEELIGHPISAERDELLEYIRPQYLILKPALCYGFSGACDWIERAGRLGIGYWVTSALESSVGLNAIAQFTGTLRPEIPQGLGTGNLFTNNFSTPLLLEGDRLTFTGPAYIYNSELERLDWTD